MGTTRPKGKQRKKHFMDLEDAMATQALWEHERMQTAAALRPKITRLSQAELAQAEAAVEILRDTGYSLLDAVRHGFRSAPAAGQEARPIKDALQQFLAEREPFVGPRRHQSLRTTGEQFLQFVGANVSIADITTERVLKWLRAKGDLKKKSWNNYRADLFTLFAWCAARPRSWITENPVTPVPQHKIIRALPERLEVGQARELMLYLEEKHPEWCVCFVLTLFLGIRPDRKSGELAKLAACVERDGLGKYLCNGALHITAEISKDQRSRQAMVPTNVEQWLSRYKVTPTAIWPESHLTYQFIRDRFQIPHDGLRHTAISAHVSLHGSFADAACQFGNSESMIRAHYFNRMSKDEAAEFYRILPRL
ncbi:MAG: hypothetical protein ABIV50_08740 [Opitutus sp.]